MLPFALPLAASFMPAASSAAGAGASSWLPALGGVLGGMGQFAGGVSGMFGGSDHIDQTPANKAWRRHKQQMQNQIRWRVKDAKKAGLHPLAALGISPASGPSMGPSVGSQRDTGRSLANMGQGLQRALAGKNELDQAMARYYNAMAERAMRPVISGQPQSVTVDSAGVVNSGKTYKPVLAEKPVQGSFGYEGGKAGFYQFATTDNGGVQTFPTQTLQESTSEGVHAIEYGLKVAGKYLRGASFDLLMTPKAMMSRNALRNEQRAVEREFGGRWAYDIGTRTWHRTNTNRLYMNNKLHRFTRKYEYGSGKLQKSHKTPPSRRQQLESESWYFD